MPIHGLFLMVVSFIGCRLATAAQAWTGTCALGTLRWISSALQAFCRGLRLELTSFIACWCSLISFRLCLQAIRRAKSGALIIVALCCTSFCLPCLLQFFCCPLFLSVAIHHSHYFLVSQVLGDPSKVHLVSTRKRGFSICSVRQ